SGTKISGLRAAGNPHISPLRQTYVSVAMQLLHERRKLLAAVSERLTVDKRPKPARARWVAQLPQRLDFDLADAFPGNLKILSYLFQSMFRSVFQAKAHLDDPFFPWVECAQDAGGLFFQIHADHGIGRRN